MKTLLSLKYVDLLIQGLALVIPLVSCLFYGGANNLAAYFTVGGAQVLSCLAHIGLPSRLRSDQRKYYEWTLATVLLLFLVAALLLLPVVLYLALGLLFISPFLALWYTLICYQELCTVKRYTDRKKYVLTN